MKDVHTEHCCLLHGCKYGKDDTCTVVTKAAPQSYTCECCSAEGIEDVATLNKILHGTTPRCQHCGHINP